MRSFICSKLLVLLAENWGFEPHFEVVLPSSGPLSTPRQGVLILHPTPTKMSGLGPFPLSAEGTSVQRSSLAQGLDLCKWNRACVTRATPQLEDHSVPQTEMPQTSTDCWLSGSLLCRGRPCAGRSTGRCRPSASSLCTRNKVGEEGWTG